MSGLAYLVPTLFIIATFVIVVEIATVALRLTGLNRKQARFQALSAFTGTGFTTKEAEEAVNDSRRRRIIMLLMVLGNAGLVSVIATLIGTFASPERSATRLLYLFLLALGIYIIYWVASNQGLTQRLERWFEHRLTRSQLFNPRKLEEVLHLTQEFSVAEIRIPEDSPLIGHSLAETRLSEQDILVLAIERSGEIIPTPKGKDTIQRQDHLVCYGQTQAMKRLLEQGTIEGETSSG